MELEQVDLSDPKKFFEELVKKALVGKNSNFEFIRSYDMLRVARMYRSGVHKVAKVFNNLRKALLKEYADAILTDEQRLEMLMSAMQFEQCRDYYRKELAIAKDMISEYKTYVFSGHILDTMLGYSRPEEECVDYRKLPIKWF